MYKEHMCATMASGHRSMKISRDHTVVTLEDLGKDPSLLLSGLQMCPHHPNQEFLFYDKDISRSICRDCAVTVAHQGHKAVDLVDAAAKLRIELSEMSAIVAQRVNELAAAESGCGAARKHIEDRYAAEGRKVQDTFESAREALADREATVLQELASAFQLKHSALNVQVSQRITGVMVSATQQQGIQQPTYFETSTWDSDNSLREGLVE
jgi:hypothetical protein